MNALNAVIPDFMRLNWMGIRSRGNVGAGGCTAAGWKES